MKATIKKVKPNRQRMHEYMIFLYQLRSKTHIFSTVITFQLHKEKSLILIHKNFFISLIIVDF